LKTAAVAGLALSPVVAQALEAVKPEARPNFLFVLIDDLRYDLVGCTGHPYAKTPNIDRIAKNGVKFANAFVTTSLCSPSRASFLSGKYVHTHGVWNNVQRIELDPAIDTWPKLLRKAGYDTAFIGKWHQGKGSYPRPGFNHWVSFDGQGVYMNPDINIDGKMRKMDGAYITDVLNDAAMEWLRKDRTSPFCLYLSHKAIHEPFRPAERHKDLYIGQKAHHPPSFNDNLEGKPVWLKKTAKVVAPDKQKVLENWEEQTRMQLRTLAAVDEGLGKILDYLAQAGKLDDTVIAFAGDNGFYQGEHGLGDKRSAYEESMRIPLLMSYPKMAKPGGTIKEMVLNIDVAPTMLDLAGVKIPEGMQGKSMVPLLKGKRAEWRKSFLYEYMQEKRYPQTPNTLAVRTDRWKYIRYPGADDIEELYDLKNDPYELKNLASDPAHSSALAEMKKEMDKLMVETGGKGWWDKYLTDGAASAATQ